VNGPMAGIDKATWRAVNALLDELLEMPATVRAARLEQVQRENPVCAREAAALLAEQAAVEREHFLECSPSCRLSGEKNY
jgi:hypothetical protein